MHTEIALKDKIQIETKLAIDEILKSNFIHSLTVANFINDLEIIQKDIILSLVDDLQYFNRIIQITFQNSQEEKLPDRTLQLFPDSIIIEDITDRGWENAKFKINDIEHSGFSLICNEITIQIEMQ